MSTYNKLSAYNKKHLKLDRFQIFVKGSGEIGEVFCEGEVTIEMVREGAPSKLTMSVIDDGHVKIANGNSVNVMVDGETFWYGYIFKTREEREPLIECIAYDQLRYLKNKDTYQYEDITYSDLLQQIISDQGLIAGEIEDTGYQIAGRIEEDKEYYDMLQVAHQYTVAYTGELFVLFDKAGKIHLQNIKSLKVDTPVIDIDITQNMEYECNIDENTFNRIKIDLIDEQQNVVRPIIAEDADNVAKWGVLQYYAQTTERDTVEAKAQILLEVLNREMRKLKLFDVFGDVNIRAGHMVPVALRLRDIAINGYMVVESVTHIFREGWHTMEMRLLNKDFQIEVNPDGFLKNERKGTSGGGGGGAMSGDTIQEQIWSYFLSKGYSKEAIAAIMGNISQESGFSTTSENSIGAYGLVQWLGPRREALNAYAASKGTSPSDLLTQLEFIDKELMEMNGGRDFTRMTDVTQATIWFNDKYERPHPSEANKPHRISEANRFYNQLVNWTPPPAQSGALGSFMNYVLAQEGGPYSQERRFDGAYHDCSSLILRGLRAAGLDTTGANLTTYTMPGDPRFEQIPWSQMRPGDILWNQGHVEVFMGGNKTFGAMDYGVPTGYSSNINRFNRVYRIKGT